MLRNYFKTAYRNFARNKIYALINVFGMSLAFMCGILLFLNVWYELSYDEFYPDKERIYKIYTSMTGEQGEERGASMPLPLASAIKTDVPSVAYVSRIMWNNSGVEYRDKKLDLSTTLVDEDFFKIFSSKFIDGNHANPLHDAENAVITASAAEKIFGKENPIGKRIKINALGDKKELTVTAIAKDNPENSSIQFDVLARPEIRKDFQEEIANWNNWNHEVYVKLAEGASVKSATDQLRSMLKKYSPEDTAYMKSRGNVKDEFGFYLSMKLFPFTEVHFDAEIGAYRESVNKTYLYTLLLISFFIIAIASFNFFNLNVARAFTRTKEVGVRKCLGAGDKQVFFQIWVESFILCFVALLIGILSASFLIPGFNQLFGAKLSLHLFYQPSFISILLTGLLLISFCAGGYPALIISRLPVSGVLKGNVSINKPGFFRNSLIVVQFAIACLLMAGTIIAYRQFEYMRNMPLGYSKEAVISVPLYGLNEMKGRDVLRQLRNRLNNDADVISITGSSVNFGLGKDGSTSRMGRGFDYKEKSIMATWLSVDFDFLQTLGVNLLKGRDFSREYATDTASAVIVTESMARQFGEKDVIGLSFSIDTARPPLTIIGIIPDFHLYSVHEKSSPLTIDVSQEASLNYALIKTQSQNPKAVMDRIEKIYKTLAPNREFSGSFLDENTDRWYIKEKQLSVLLGISATVAIAISCLGLFALALLMIQQRIKEIGVRKVLGASVMNINVLLVKDFIKLVIAGIVIAVPLAWWAMNSWLQDFPYHIEITWFIFLVVALLALLISLLTVSFHTIKAALSNPVKSLRNE